MPSKSQVASTIQPQDHRTKYTKRQSNLPVPYEKKKKPIWDNKYFYIGSSVIAGILLLYNIGAFNGVGGKSVPVTAQKADTTQVINIYRQALKGDEKGALSKFESIGYANLSKDDQKIMLNLYNRTDQLEKDG